MATAKKTAPKKTPAKKAPASNNAWSSVQLPAGFRTIAAGEYGEEWDYEKNPLLQGTVVSDVREVEAGKGRDKRVQRVVSIKSDDDGRTYTLWDSASLKEFFNHLHRGQQIAVVFRGYKDVGRPQPMKVFEGAYTDEDAEALDESPAPAPRAAKKAAAKKRR